MTDQTEKQAEKIVVCYSGGLDSTTLLYKLHAAGAQVSALMFDYGQRHRCELRFAEAHCRQLGIESMTADVRSLRPLLAGSSQTTEGIAVPEGHYTAETMKATIVPNRNMIMLSIAAGWAVSRKYDAVAYAAHAGDHAIYPDCRPAFADAVAAALRLSDWHPVQLLAPFVKLTKADIVAEAAKLGVPLAQTWSCYQGSEIHCGRCGTCVERREAFEIAGIIDPTEYEPGEFI